MKCIMGWCKQYNMEYQQNNQNNTKYHLSKILHKVKRRGQVRAEPSPAPRRQSGELQLRSVALRISSMADCSSSSCPLAWITLCAPTKARLSVSKLEE